MAKFSLEGSEEYYLKLSEPPKRFDADSPVTNVFFDDTNGQVFTVRSGGVTGVTVIGMDSSKNTSFRMEDKGSIISIKFSPDHKILAIQRNHNSQNPMIEFVNFQDLAPTNVEYSHTCKWKNAKILGFVWPKANEIAFVTDHGIELLQVLPDKKLLKSLKSISFSGAWFSWCAPSNIVLLAGNNGALLQPFSLNSSSITKLQKLELDAARPVVERDVFLLRLCNATWCAVFRHGLGSTAASPGPTEVWLLPVSGAQPTHVLRTGLVGRFAVNVVDDLVVVHHQSSQSSQAFDIQEACRLEGGAAMHSACAAPAPLRPAALQDQPCPMYSSNWVVFQPDYIIDARLGCLWRLALDPPALAYQIPRDDIPKIVAVLLRRTGSEDTIYRILIQLVENADTYLVELTKVFDEINSVYRQWAELEVARNTAGAGAEPRAAGRTPVLVSQPELCARVLHARHHLPRLVQVVIAYLGSLSRHNMVVQHPVAEECVRVLVTRGCLGRLRALVRRGCLGDARPLACQLLALGQLQLALDMMARLQRHEDIVEVLLGWEEPVCAGGVARAAGALGRVPARKLLAAARRRSPAAFLALYHALRAANRRARHSPAFLPAEQCDVYDEYYKQLTNEQTEAQ